MSLTNDLFFSTARADFDCGADLTITNTTQAEDLFTACPTLTGDVSFEITAPDVKLTYAWEQSYMASISGPNLTFILGGPNTTELNMTRLYIQPGVAMFKLGEALKRLTVTDLSIDGETALEDGEYDPCDPIFEEIQGSGAHIGITGCGMKPNITVDWHDGLKGSAVGVTARLGAVIGLGVVTALLVV